MQRFEREARFLASLNHPNIAAIYELEESNDIRALVIALLRWVARPKPFGTRSAERLNVPLSISR
jgi:serine/threonine protein kinase